MAYRNGTYVAFNGCGTSNPIESDIKYYNLLTAWNENKNIDFRFSNSHEKTSQVKDSSKLETLKATLKERMKNSKNMLLLLTENSSDSTSLINWEIETAVQNYSLPLIVAYVNCDQYFTNVDPYEQYWPPKLLNLSNEMRKTLLIGNNDVKLRSIHIPFKKEIILHAIQTFTVSNLPMYNITIYSRDSYDRICS